MIRILILLLISTSLWAEEQPAYWEVGAGLGAVYYEQYPAADQHDSLVLPFPTFQYRGKILRADDRDGAHLYLFKKNNWTLEFSGTGFMPLDSGDNDDRKDMKDIPVVIATGPQMIYRWSPDFQFGLGLFQAFEVELDLSHTGISGQILEGQLVHTWDHQIQSGIFEGHTLYGRTGFTTKFATKDLNSLYYDVPADKATTDRPKYESDHGYLSSTLSYFQSLKKGRWNYYIGVSCSDYSLSANRQSALHKKDGNFSGFISLAYTFFESDRPAILPEETSGLLNRLSKDPL